MSQSKDTNGTVPVMSVTPSPYEQLDLFNHLTESKDILMETKRLRLECILAAITTGIRDSTHVVETAQKFWDFIHNAE